MHGQVSLAAGAMNMAIRGIDFDFGKRNADSFTDDQHPDLLADYLMANPPFNNEGEIRKALIEADLVESMVPLP